MHSPSTYLGCVLPECNSAHDTIRIANQHAYIKAMKAMQYPELMSVLRAKHHQQLQAVEGKSCARDWLVTDPLIHHSCAGPIFILYSGKLTKVIRYRRVIRVRLLLCHKCISAMEYSRMQPNTRYVQIWRRFWICQQIRDHLQWMFLARFDHRDPQQSLRQSSPACACASMNTETMCEKT